jgi:hypothetical protein
MEKMIDNKKWSTIKNDQQSKILIVNKFYYHWLNNFDENWPKLLLITLLSIIWQIVDPEKLTMDQ